MKVPTSGVLAELPVVSPAEHLASAGAWEEIQQLHQVWQQEAAMSYLLGFDSWEASANEDMLRMYYSSDMMPMYGGPYPFTATTLGVLPSGRA